MDTHQNKDREIWKYGKTLHSVNNNNRLKRFFPPSSFFKATSKPKPKSSILLNNFEVILKCVLLN